jgi:hypothetical protein
VKYLTQQRNLKQSLWSFPHVLLRHFSLPPSSCHLLETTAREDPHIKAVGEDVASSQKSSPFNDCFSFPTPTNPPGKSLQESQEEAASWRSSQEETAIDLFPAQRHSTIHPN